MPLADYIYHETEQGVLYCGDCLEILPLLADKSVDMILCDLPYGTTACHWDTIIPFEPLWLSYKRLAKERSAIVLTASQPFTSALVMSNIKMFRHEWIWMKTRHSNFMCLDSCPMKMHESVCVFGLKSPSYYPQMTKGDSYIDNRKAKKRIENISNAEILNFGRINNGTRHPDSIICFENGNNNNEHPTQKPVDLFAYLIKTYTNENDIVMDNCAGSGTTAVASINTKRRYILIEKEERYCEIARKRIETALDQTEIEI